jgi:hypothetical protein
VFGDGVINFFIRIVGGGVQTVSTWHFGHLWPIVPAPGGCEDWAFGGMKTGRGNRSTRRKPAPAPLCPPQIPLDQTRARTRAFAVRNQRLTAWLMALPEGVINYEYYVFGHYPSSYLYLKRRPVYFSKYNVLETGFYLRLRVRPTQLGPIDRASPYLRS